MDLDPYYEIADIDTDDNAFPREPAKPTKVQLFKEQKDLTHLIVIPCRMRKSERSVWSRDWLKELKIPCVQKASEMDSVSDAFLFIQTKVLKMQSLKPKLKSILLFGLRLFGSPKSPQ